MRRMLLEYLKQGLSVIKSEQNNFDKDIDEVTERIKVAREMMDKKERKLIK